MDARRGQRVRVDVGRAKGGDVPAIMELLARAFHEDPNFTALFPDARRRPRALRRLFLTELREALSLGFTDVARDDGRIVGAAVWYPPGTFPLSWHRRLRAVPAGIAAMATYPTAARPMLEMINRLEAHRPRERHWYLGTVGVAPEAQRGGFGRALLAEGLARADTSGEPSYLEAAKSVAAAWYERAGFEIVGRAQLVPRGGPTCWLMQRPPGGQSP